MRTVAHLIPILLLLAGCTKSEPQFEEPQPIEGARPEGQTPTDAPVNLPEVSLKDVTLTRQSYADYFHNIEIRTTAAVALPELTVDFGVMHSKNLYSLGRIELRGFYDEYNVGDTLVVNISIPFWQGFRTPEMFNPEALYACEDAYAAGNLSVLNYYESMASGRYCPTPIARVDSALIIDLSTPNISGWLQ